MKLSVVIPCYNGAETIDEQLAALSDQAWEEPWEVVVADNGSTDDSMTIVEQYRDRLPELRIVDAGARQGQPYALNVGWRAARGRSVAFVDADDVVAAGWLPAIGEALEHHDFVASRHDGEKLNPDTPLSGRAATQRDGLQIIWYPPYLPHAGGCGLGLRRDLLATVGGFDESLPYLHDTDLCFKVQKQRVALRFVPEATIYIRFRQESADMFRQARMWARYNVLVYKRHRPREQRVSRPWRDYLADWWRIARRLRSIRNPVTRTRLTWQAGWQVGLLEGTLRYGAAPVPFRTSHTATGGQRRS